MAKATIVLEDDPDTGEVKLAVDFDPPITEEAEPSHAANMAVTALKYLTETYQQGKEPAEAPVETSH